MGDVIFFRAVFSNPARRVQTRGLWLAERVWDCDLVLFEDLDDNREAFRLIEAAIVEGKHSITIGDNIKIAWKIFHPWELDEDGQMV